MDSSGQREDWFREYCKILKDEKRKAKEKDREHKKEKEKHLKSAKKDKDKGEAGEFCFYFKTIVKVKFLVE